MVGGGWPVGAVHHFDLSSGWIVPSDRLSFKFVEWGRRCGADGVGCRLRTVLVRLYSRLL